MTYLEYIDKVIALIDRGWCQGSCCLPENARLGSEDVTHYCLYGATIGAGPSFEGALLKRELRDRTGDNYITWQDEPHRTKQDVLILLRWIRKDAECALTV